MTRINLLPWRQMARKEKQREFFSIGIGAIILMGAIILYIHLHMASRISDQNTRNEFMDGEIQRVDNQIKEIKGLETERDRLLARMKVIQQLQASRSRIVHIIDELEKRLPESVYLTVTKQAGGELLLQGVAPSNASVSNFMRNLEASDWFENPRLEVIQAVEKVDEKTKEVLRGSQFTLHVKQTGVETEDEQKDSKNKGKGNSKTKAGTKT